MIAVERRFVKMAQQTELENLIPREIINVRLQGENFKILYTPLVKLHPHLIQYSFLYNAKSDKA